MKSILCNSYLSNELRQVSDYIHTIQNHSKLFKTIENPFKCF